MPMKETPELASLTPEALAQLIGEKKSPPVHLWNPEHTSDSYMIIDRNGRWFHRGEPISRPAMVALFASILRREDDGRYALVTPYEKQFITVEDTPFLATDMRYDAAAKPPVLAFKLNNGELVVANADHKVEAVPDGDDIKFYLTVRPGLQAKLNRSTHIAMINLLLAQEPKGQLAYADKMLAMQIPQDVAG